MIKTVVLGSGAWGTAMAFHLASCGHQVWLVTRDEATAQLLKSSGGNEAYIPGLKFPQNLVVSSDFNVLLDSDLAFLACPSQGIYEFCQRIGEIPFGRAKKPLVVTLCKGFVPETFDLPTSIVQKLLPTFDVAVLSGPTHALDVAKGKPTAAVLASCIEEERLEKFQEAINSSQFRIYRSADLLGVELGGCLKNPYAIGMGFAAALDYGDNGRAALLTRMMTELARIGTALGGKNKTFYGLSGLGDLLATAQGTWSRNRQFGERIARGESVEAIFRAQKVVVEGYRATKGFYDICRRHNIECPIMTTIYKILYGECGTDTILVNLMERELKAED